MAWWDNDPLASNTATLSPPKAGNWWDSDPVAPSQPAPTPSLEDQAAANSARPYVNRMLGAVGLDAPQPTNDPLAELQSLQAPKPIAPQPAQSDADYMRGLLQKNEEQKNQLRAAGIPEDQLDAALYQQNLQSQAAADVANRPANAVTGSLAYRIPQNIVTSLGTHFASIAGMIESGLAKVAPESVGEFIKQGREDVRNYQRADAARQAELDKQGWLGESATGVIRSAGSTVGEAAALAPLGLPGMAAYFGLSRASEGMTDGESPILAGTHGAIDAAWTYLGGKLLGAGTGKLANEAEGIGGKAAQWLAQKFRLPTWTAPLIEGSGGQAAQAVGQEASNYLADVAAGKHSFNRDEFIRRMESAASQAALVGGLASGVHQGIPAIRTWAGGMADAMQERIKAGSRVVEAVKDAQQYDGEVPPTARRGFEQATGQTNTNKLYREAFVDEVRQRNAELNQEPATEEGPLPDTAGDRLYTQPLTPERAASFQKELASIRRQSPELADELARLHPQEAAMVLADASERAQGENEYLATLRQQYGEVFGDGRTAGARSARAAKKLANGADETSLKHYDLIAEELRSDKYAELASEVSKRGYGNIESGILAMQAGGKKQFAPVSNIDFISDSLEAYRKSLPPEHSYAQSPETQGTQEVPQQRPSNHDAQNAQGQEVLKSGNWITAFHGSPDKIEGTPTVSRFQSGDAAGVYFTGDNEAARGWSTWRDGVKGPEGVVGQYEIRLDNPAKYADKAKAIRDLEASVGNDWTPQQLTDLLKSRGFDGIIDDSYKGNEYVVFDDSQIRVAGGSQPPEPMPGPSPAPKGVLRISQNVPMDDVIKDARHGLNRVKALLKRGFLGQGTLPKDIYSQKLAKDARIASDLKQLDFGVRDYEQALKRVYGGREYVPATERAKLSAVLKGELPATELDPRLQEPIAKMRTHIDALSRRMIESGAAEGPVSLTIENNLGTYVTRSYRVFDDPAWAAKVPEPIRNQAKAALRSEYPDATEQQIAHSIESLLYSGKAADTPMAVLSRSKLGSKDLSVLMERKNLPLWLRQLWGEYDDPAVQYTRSVTKMAHLIGNHQFLSTVRDEGLGRYFFEKSDPNIDPEAKAQISSDGSKVMAPLNGLWTFPEIKAAFEREYDPPNTHWFMRNYLRVNGLVKTAKTIFAPVTQIRNFTANFEFGWIAGVRLREGLRGLTESAPGIESILGPRAEESRTAHKRLIELGVIDEGVNASELRQALSDAADMNPDQFSERTIERWLAKAKKSVTDLYQFSDAAHRVMGFYALKRQYGEAHPDWTPQQLDAKAAELVSRIYPTYSRVGEGVKKLGSRIPLVGTFVQFPAEVVRTTISTLQLIREELADPATRQVGANRLARVVAAASIPAAAGAASRLMTGVSRDDEQDARLFLPPWSENADILWMERDKDGSLRYVDTSYSDPHSYLKKPVRAFLRGEEQGPADAAKEFFAPFASEEILAGKLIDLARNRTPDGRTVYNPQAPATEQFRDSFAHVWDALEPGVITSANRVKKGLTGEIEPTGRSYNAKDELLALATGTRIQKIDLRKSLGFKAYQYAQQLQDARRMFTTAATSRGTVSEDDLKSAYSSAESAQRALFDNMHKMAAAAMRLGVSESEATQIIADAAGKENAQAIVAGIYRPYVPSPQILRKVVRAPGGQQRLQYVRGALNPPAAAPQ